MTRAGIEATLAPIRHDLEALTVVAAIVALMARRNRARNRIVRARTCSRAGAFRAGERPPREAPARHNRTGPASRGVGPGSFRSGLRPGG